MPRDFRITYPKTLKEYDDLSHQHLPIQNRGVLDGKGEIMCSKNFFLDFFKEAIEVSRKYEKSGKREKSSFHSRTTNTGL